ncbi:VOC family protein [Dactylosporangium sucinum]|uniref:VOC family protein n=1 Tax=Dactylosporangium sucinum TaxID=1424081 RepID=UPI00167C6257|nr:VOC family protein [Dactylosporangium sucinum]
MSDLARSCAFYGDVFGYRTLGETTVAGRDVEALWQMPAGLTGQCRVVGPPGASTGLLRLVQFDAPGERIWGDYSRARDYGHYALNIRVDDIRSAIAKLRESGGSSKSEPTRWTVNEDISAWDSLSYDPDGVILDVFQLFTREGSALASYDGRPSELQTVAMHCSNARKSAQFYGALGYVPLYDRLLENMESFFKLPAGTALHNINLYMPGDTPNGRVELAEYVGYPGEDQRARAVPPNIGILSASMYTDDLAATSALLGTLEAQPVCDIVEVELPPYGRALVRTYFGPDGEVLEFYQPL